MSERLVGAIREDLARAWSGLLDDGLERATGGAVSFDALGARGLALAGARVLRRVVPTAIRDAAEAGGLAEEGVARSPVPRRARPTARAADYVAEGGRVAPLHWETIAAAPAAPPATLAWILGAIELVRGLLAEQQVLLAEARDEAVRFRSGSAFGREEIERLAAAAARLSAADADLARLVAEVRGGASVRLRPSARRPVPFPRGRSWRRLDAVVAALRDPTRAAPLAARALLHCADDAIDPGYLYQRWCGWKIVEALRAAGLEWQRPPLAPLLFSGPITFQGEGIEVTLLCEPRLVRGKSIGGVQVQRGEATPDFVLRADGRDGPIAYVLDPTLRVADHARAEKAKYLDLIRLVGSHRVAGVRTLPGPERSWAAAPISSSTCLVSDWRGSHGTVPMNPLDWRPGALTAWLEDLLDAARDAAAEDPER